MTTSAERILRTAILARRDLSNHRVRLALVIQNVPMAVRYSLFLFIATIPFEAAALPFTTGSLSIAKISGLFLAAAYCFYRFVSTAKSKTHWAPPALWWFLGFFLIRVLRGFFVAEDELGGVLSSNLTRLQLIILFWVISDVMRDMKISAMACTIFVFATVAMSFGMILNVFNIDAEGPRMTALGFNLNTIGGIMAVAFVGVVGLIQNGTFRKLIPNGLLVLSLLPLAKVIVSTGSRSAIATVIGGCLVYSLSVARGRRKFIVVAILAMGLAANVYLTVHNSLTMERWQEAYYDYDFSGRTAIYSEAIGMILEKPLLGWGAGASSYELGRRLGREDGKGEHNLLLQLLNEVGLIGTIPFLIGVWLVVRKAWKARGGALGYLPIALLAAVGANTMVENGLDFRSKLFWLVLAVAYSASASRASMRLKTITLAQTRDSEAV